MKIKISLGVANEKEIFKINNRYSSRFSIFFVTFGIPVIEGSWLISSFRQKALHTSSRILTFQTFIVTLLVFDPEPTLQLLRLNLFNLDMECKNHCYKLICFLREKQSLQKYNVLFLQEPFVAKGSLPESYQ